MKHRNRSIHWKLLFYLVIFVLTIVSVLWFVQTVYLGKFYEQSRIASIRRSAEYIAQQIDSQDMDSVLERISMQDDIYAHVLDSTGQVLYHTKRLQGNDIDRMEPREVSRLLEEVQQSKNGTVLRRIQKQFPPTKEGNPPWREWNRDLHGTENIVFATTATTVDGELRYILGGSVITPVDTTVSVLRSQLVYVTVFLVAAAAFLAWLLSRKIAQPIIAVNKLAKELPRRNYSITFESEDTYLEIAELTDTLNEAAREIGKTERLRRELMANISHDLRTPLTMIIGYSEAMRDLPGENTPQNVQVIIDEANRLTRLVEDVLDISKLESGTQSFDPQPFHLTRGVKAAITRCDQLTQPEGYHIDFSPQEEVWVTGDEQQLLQVIYNLVGNAITHTGSDRRVKVRQTCENGKVRISVDDSGVGIPPDQLEDIWQRYYKVDKTHLRAPVGTGLGLSIVKGIIQRHGGICGVESTVGQGSTFWFELATIENP